MRYYMNVIKLRLRLRVATIKKASCARLRVRRGFGVRSCGCGNLKQVASHALQNTIGWVHNNVFSHFIQKNEGVLTLQACYLLQLVKILSSKNRKLEKIVGVTSLNFLSLSRDSCKDTYNLPSNGESIVKSVSNTGFLQILTWEKLNKEL